jgi:hypothetical protein
VPSKCRCTTLGKTGETRLIRRYSSPSRTKAAALRLASCHPRAPAKMPIAATKMITAAPSPEIAEWTTPSRTASTRTATLMPASQPKTRAIDRLAWTRGLTTAGVCQAEDAQRRVCAALRRFGSGRHGSGLDEPLPLVLRPSNMPIVEGRFLLGIVLSLVLTAGCTASSHAGVRVQKSPTSSSAAPYGSAVAAVRASCHADKIMFHGRNLPADGKMHPTLRRIGWQSADQPVGVGWVAAVRAHNGDYTVEDCKSQGITHG